MTARTCLTCEYEPAWREQVSLDGECVDSIGRCAFPDAALRGVIPEGSLFAGPLGPVGNVTRMSTMRAPTC